MPVLPVTHTDFHAASLYIGDIHAPCNKIALKSLIYYKAYQSDRFKDFEKYESAMGIALYRGWGFC